MSKRMLMGFVIFLMFFACKEESPSEPEIIGNGYIIGHVIKDSDGNPVANVSIFTTPPTSQVSTNLSGDFVIANVDSGQYQVNAVKNGYESMTVGISLSHGDTARADFILVPDGTGSDTTDNQKGYIKGTVRDIADNSILSMVNISTVPITGSLLTDSEGRFFIPNLTPGTYRIVALKQAYDSTSIGVTVTAGDTTNADLFMVPRDTSIISSYGEISGHIIDAISGGGLKNVVISTTPSTSVINSDATGFYKFVGIQPGNYTINVTKVGYISQSIEVLVQAGLITTADFNLIPTTGTLTGRVTSSYNGLAIFGAIITADHGTYQASSDRDGYFAIDNMETGTYTLYTTHASFKSDTTEISIQPGVTTNVPIALDSN